MRQQVVKGQSRELPRLELVLLTAVVGLYITLVEIDRLIKDVSADGYSVTMAAVSGFRLPKVMPGQVHQPWLSLHNLDSAADPFVIASMLTDTVMAGCYALLLWLLVKRLVASGVGATEAPLRLLTKPRTWAPWVAAGCDLVENLFLLALVLLGDVEQEMNVPLAVGASWATFLKWVFLTLSVLPLLFALFGTSRGRARARRWGRALFEQKFSLFAITPIAILVLIPGSGIFDQLPDVQRAWFEIGDGRGWSGPGHALWAIVLLSALAFGLFILGRLCTDDAVRRSLGRGKRPRTRLWQWGYPLVMLGLLVVWARALGGSIRLPQLIPLALILVVIALGSWLLRRFRRNTLTPPDLPAQELPVSEIWRMGDALALAAVVIASLGLVRSYVVLLVLGIGNPIQSAMPFLGLLAAIIAWVIGVPALAQVGRRVPMLKRLIQLETDGILSGQELAEDLPSDRLRNLRRDWRRLWIVSWVVIVLTSAVLVGLAVLPSLAAATLGVLGAMMLALGSITLLIGASIIANTFWAPPEVFWIRWFRLRNAPIGTLFALFLVAATMMPSTPEVYGVRDANNQAAGFVSQPTSISFDEAVADWRDRTEDCIITQPDGQQVRPMVFIAAKGGGIRAAYWTAATLSLLEEQVPGDCAIAATVVASGVSGGSLGLAVARSVPVSDADAAVWRLSDGQALAQATLGMLVRDPMHAAAGIPAPSPGPWLDRAGLMEVAWEEAVPSLGDDFYGDAAAGGLEAPLILNSTDTASGCRVLVTQLETGEWATESVPCAEADAPLPYSYDFRDYLTGPNEAAEQVAEDDQCLDGLSASSAAMLSARFPYVTPSGVVGPCRGAQPAQLIDGGYAEVSGLASLFDVAPRLLAEAGEDDVPVLPIVIHLDNGRGSDLLPMVPETHSELLVPLVGLLHAGGTQKSPTAWLQRSLELHQGRGNVAKAQVFTITQGTEPAIEAPLGWVLSKASRDDMDDSLARAVTRCGTEGAEDATNGQEYQDLTALLELFGGCQQ